jgi:hypothetical protein
VKLAAARDDDDPRAGPAQGNLSFVSSLVERYLALRQFDEDFAFIDPVSQGDVLNPSECVAIARESTPA